MPYYHSLPAPPSTSDEGLLSAHDFPGIVPAGFTFQNYVDGSPPVNGRLMALFAGSGKRVHLLCEVLSSNEEAKTAIVRAADGAEITVVDVNAPIQNPCLEIWGLPTAATVLSAISIEPLSDDHDFDRAQWFIEFLLKPSTWGERPPTQAEQGL